MHKYHKNIYEKLKSYLNLSHCFMQKEREAIIILENSMQQNNLSILV